MNFAINISNLPVNSLSEVDIQNLILRFDSSLEINSIRLLRDVRNSSKGMAVIVVQFKDEKEARTFVETIDGNLFRGIQIKAAFARDRNLKEKEDYSDRTFKNKGGRSIYFDFTFTDADRRSIARERRRYNQDFRCEIFNDEMYVTCEGLYHVGDRRIKLSEAKLHHEPPLARRVTRKDLERDRGSLRSEFKDARKIRILCHECHKKAHEKDGDMRYDLPSCL